MGRESRRDQRRWQRELEEQLRALPTYDGDTPDGGEVDPLARRLPRPPRAPRREREPGAPRRGAERRRTWWTVGITLAVVIGLFGASLTPLVASLRGLLGLEGDRGSSTTYQFLAEDTLSGRPVRWSSCTPIRYVVNPAQAPDGWEETLDYALSEITRASGLEFEPDGQSSDGVESDRYARGNRPKPVLVSWVSPSEEPVLEGDTVGVAGPSSLNGVYVTGTVFLDAPAFAEMEDRGDEELQRSILMHELGHLVGLDHVQDQRQLMYPSTTYQTTFGNGDLEGLAVLGDGPCL